MTNKKRKGNYKFKVGDLVRYEDIKAEIIHRWWDNVSSNRYEIRFIVGKNKVGNIRLTKENSLEPWETK